MIFFLEIMKYEISKWREDDKVYVETHNFQAMLEKVRTQPFVTFVGVPGSGKTATARHIALILQEEGYDILPIRTLRNIQDYCDHNNPQVFLFDDVLGVFELDEYNFNMLHELKHRIMNPANSKSKTLMTCREVIYRNHATSQSFLTKAENVVSLHSEENALSCEDKNALLAKYDINLQISSSINDGQTSLMFPFLCKLFSRKEELKVYGPNFFQSPVPIILGELDRMQSKNKVHYASLVLLMTNQNTLLEDDLVSTDKSKLNQIKTDVLRKFQISTLTGEGICFTNALTEMEGTFVRKCGRQFMFLNESIFEIIAYHFGRQFPETILQNMSSDYIANYIKVNSEMDSKCEKDESRLHNNIAIDLCIRLREPYYQMFAERLFRDVGDGEMYNVFTNEALNLPSVIKVFISVMETKSYTELYSAFLVALKQMSEDVNKFKRLKVCRNKQMGKLLLQLMDAHSGGIFRAISWVISFGHHQILKFITDQILIHTENIYDLFGISFKKDHQNYSDVKQDNTFNEKQTFVDITMEQCQLLCLGCCSGDLNTVQILLKYVDKDAINNTATHAKHVYLNIKPLVVACTFGYLDIAKELVKAGADVNLRDDFDSPLTAAHKDGHMDVVEWLRKAGAVATS